MKKLLYRLGSIGVIVAPIIGIISCGGIKTFQVKHKAINEIFKGKKVANTKIAAVVSDPENPRWQKAKNELTAAGIAQGFNISTNILKKQSAQNEWIKTQINNGVKGLIIGSTDASVGGPINTASSKKIPVVAYDRLIKTNSLTYNWYVTFDNSLVGQLQGLSILSNIYKHKFTNIASIAPYVKEHKLTSEADFLTIGGDPADNNAHLFWGGGHQVLKKAMDIDSNLKELTPNTFAQVAQKNWDYAKGKAFFDTQLSKLSATKRKNIRAILTPNDGMATGAAIPSLRKYHLNPTNIYITGQDSNDKSIISIAKDKGQNMSIFKPDALASRMAIAILHKLITTTGATPEQVTHFLHSSYPNITFRLDKTSYTTGKNGKSINTILLTPKVVTKDNYSDFFTVS